VKNRVAEGGRPVEVVRRRRISGEVERRERKLEILNRRLPVVVVVVVGRLLPAESRRRKRDLFSLKRLPEEKRFGPLKSIFLKLFFLTLSVPPNGIVCFSQASLFS
jgi:hypothetical protein